MGLERFRGSPAHLDAARRYSMSKAAWETLSFALNVMDAMTRFWFFATLLLLAPQAIAMTITDSAGDSGVVVMAPPTTQPVPDNTNVDLTKLVVTEEQIGFRIELELNPPIPGSPQSRWPFISIWFKDGAAQYIVQIFGQESAARFSSVDPATGVEHFIRYIDVTAQNWQITTFVPRQDILDEHGAPAYPGTVLSDWRVLAQGNHITAPNTDVSFQDTMPDIGVSDETLVGTMGSTGVGGLRAFSPYPIRGSNGAATTYLYDVVVANDASKARSINLNVENRPDGWEVQFQPRQFALKANEQIHIPVIVSAPFSHTHDLRLTVGLAATDQDGSGSAKTYVGVQYFTVPQPAGHHSFLSFHVAPTGTSLPTDVAVNDQSQRLYLNTLENDPRDLATPVPGTGTSIGSTAYRWRAYLDPALTLGLDFDLARTGKISLPLQSSLPILNGLIEGQLYLLRNQDYIPLANITSTALPSPTSGTFLIEAELVPNPAADYIPVNGTNVLGLDIILRSSKPAVVDSGLAPKLLPGGTLQLPLHEFRDAIESVLIQGTSFQVDVESALQRRAKPGDTAAFRVTVTNGGLESSAPQFELLGVNKAWSRILDGTPGGLEPGASREVYIATEVPGNAGNFDAADIILSVSGGSGAPSLTRLLVIVDEGSLEPSDAELIRSLTLPVTQKTGYAALVPALLVILALAAKRSAR